MTDRTLSSCDSYVKHRWILDLNEEDMRVLRTMVAHTMSWAKVEGGTEIGNLEYAAFRRVHDLVECMT
jgi:hypothetical protein